MYRCCYWKENSGGKLDHVGWGCRQRPQLETAPIEKHDQVVSDWHQQPNTEKSNQIKY